MHKSINSRPYKYLDAWKSLIEVSKLLVSFIFIIQLNIVQVTPIKYQISFGKINNFQQNNNQKTCKSTLSLDRIISESN